MLRYAPHRENAAARASLWLGKPFPRGWCLRWAAMDVYGVPPVADWSDPQGSTAAGYWQAAVDRGEVHETLSLNEMPPGSLLCFSGGRYGHAAIAAGLDEIITTDFPLGRVGVATLDDLADLGYQLEGRVIVDGNGWVL